MTAFLGGGIFLCVCVCVCICFLCISDFLHCVNVGYKVYCLIHRTVSFRSRILPPNSVWMEDAKLKGLQICHPQVF